MEIIGLIHELESLHGLNQLFSCLPPSFGFSVFVLKILLLKNNKFQWYARYLPLCQISANFSKDKEQ